MDYSPQGPFIKMIHLDGFQKSPYWDEQLKTYMFDTDVRIHINAPSSEQYLNTRPTQLIFFALPNGNSIEWTIGKKIREGDDWHFNIQHIGAQTRQLREIITDKNIIVAYLEANPKSWPNYRSRHSDHEKLIQEMIQAVIKQLPNQPDEIILSNHSGGGSFLFGFINNYDQIPDWVTRLSFLDSVYGYTDEDKHGDKWLDWLKRDKNHVLSIISYDDREIMLDGKKVLGPTGGTYRRTQDIIARLEKDIPLSVTTTKDYIHWKGMNNQIDIIIHPNPENKILHTVLVEKNGFIHSVTTGTTNENKAGVFWEPRAYDSWIQDELFMPEEIKK